MKRRLLLQSALPPPSGGIATWTTNLLASSLADRWDIRVVNVNAGTLDVSPRELALRKVGIAARAMAQFSAEIARFQPHVVHMCTSAQTMGLLRDAPLLRLARASGAATVLHVHGSASRIGARPELLPLMRRVLAPACSRSSARTPSCARTRAPSRSYACVRARCVECVVF